MKAPSSKQAAYPVATVAGAVALLLDEVFALELSAQAMVALTMVVDFTRAGIARHVMHKHDVK